MYGGPINSVTVNNELEIGQQAIALRSEILRCQTEYNQEIIQVTSFTNRDNLLGIFNRHKNLLEFSFSPNFK